MSERAPVETITDCDRYSWSPTQTRNGRSEKSTRVTFSVMNSAPNRSAWARKFPINSGPMMPSGKPGKFSTSVVNIN